MMIKLGLDQTRLILRLKNVNAQTLNDAYTTDARNYLAVREHINSCTQNLKMGAKHWKTKKGAMTKSVYPLDNCSVLTIALGWSTQAKHHFMTVQLNSSRFTPMAAIEINAIFDCMFDWGYVEFFNRAECSYIEIPLDVFGASMTDYLFFDTRLRSFNDFYEADGTLYLGSSTSSRYITVYDKAKEIADKGGAVITDDWLRIEPHLHPNIAAADLVHLPCAFATLRIIDKEKLASIKHNIAVDAFRNRVFAQGMQPQAAFLMVMDKKGLLAGLQPAIPNWYDAIGLWKGFPAAAHRVGPAGVQSISESPHFTTAILSTIKDAKEGVCT